MFLLFTFAANSSNQIKLFRSELLSLILSLQKSLFRENKEQEHWVSRPRLSPKAIFGIA
jgi:hypothetical protein